MTQIIKNLFWDSCVFCRYLIGSPTDFVESIEDFILEARGRDPKYKIHYSTIALAEIKPSHLAEKGYKSFQDFNEAFDGAFFPIEPNPNIMMQVAPMRDLTPHNPQKPGTRVLSTPDAIQLATCVFARDSMSISDIVFHTLDYKTGTKAGEKTIPIIGMEDWYDSSNRNRQIEDACSLTREFPIHPQPRLKPIGLGGGPRNSLRSPNPDGNPA